MIIYGVVKERNKVFFIIALAIGVLALVRGAMGVMSGSGGGVELIIGIAILLLSVYRSTSETSEEGVDEIINIAVIKKHNLWKWENIHFVYADFRLQAPLVVVSFKMEKNTRKIRFEAKDIQQVFNWAAAGNPDALIIQNSDQEYENATGEAEYRARKRGTETAEVKPKTLHEVAGYIKKQQREELLKKPDPATLHVVAPKKELKLWKDSPDNDKKKKKNKREKSV